MKPALLLSALLSGDVLIVTGQSLSEGLLSTATTTTQPYNNKMVSGLAYNSSSFIMTIPDGSSWPLVPLVESGVESPRSTFANRLHELTGSNYTVVTGSKGGAAYVDLAKGTVPFGNMAAGVESTGARQCEVVKAAYAVHGETDESQGTPRATYDADLIQWQFDIEAKAHASSCTPATQHVPLLVDQNSSWTASLYGPGLHHATATSTPLAMWDAASTPGALIYLIGPKYQYTYGSDGVHMPAASNILMAKKAAEAAYYVLTNGSWTPLWPTAISRDGATVTVTAYVPFPPLVLDTTLVTDPGCKGFTFVDDSSSASCSSVSVSGSTITVTLSGTPTGANKKLRYALTGADGNNAGPTTGARGNIRDSDADTSGYNWMIHWEEPVS